MRDVLEPTDPRRRDRSLAVPDRPRPIEQPREPSAAPAPTSEPVPLLLQHVSKWYGPVIGVNQVTLELRGGITGLVGANGAGKSTLMRLATGHLRPDIGKVSVCGVDAWTAEAKRHVGYCADADAFYEDMSGRQFVLTMARLCGYSRGVATHKTDELLELVGMTGRSDRRLRGYSKGMRQRIKLAAALVHDPELLVLDEPLSGIDPIGRHEFLTLFHDLARRGKCLLVSSHELEELEKLTDHVAIMARGRIAAVGSIAQIRDLLDDQPLSVLIAGEDSHQLAAAVLALDDVVGIELTGERSLIARVRKPRQFFAQFGRLVLEENWDIKRLEPLDGSAHAVLGYLLGGPR